MKCVVYDAGALIAADRNDRRMWAEHKVRLERGLVPLVASVVIAQVSRSQKQVQLRRLLRGCEVVSMTEQTAHRVGAILGKSKTTDVVDGAVVELAIASGAASDIVTSDPKDIARLVTTTGRPIRISMI